MISTRSLRSRHLAKIRTTCCRAHITVGVRQTIDGRLSDVLVCARCGRMVAEVTRCGV